MQRELSLDGNAPAAEEPNDGHSESPLFADAIGFRASPNEVYYATARWIDDDKFEIGGSEMLTVPRCAMHGPQKLQFLRTNIADVIKALGVKAAFVKEEGYSGYGKDGSRLRIEGVIQELVASGEVETFASGRLAEIGRLIGLDKSKCKDLKKNKRTWDDLEDPDWGMYEEAQRESILSAIAALHLDGYR